MNFPKENIYSYSYSSARYFYSNTTSIDFTYIELATASSGIKRMKVSTSQVLSVWRSYNSYNLLLSFL